MDSSEWDFDNWGSSEQDKAEAEEWDEASLAILERLRANDPTLTVLRTSGGCSYLNDEEGATDLHEQSFGPQKAKVIAEALSGNTSVTELMVWNSQVDAEGMLHFVHAVQSSTTLVKLYLSGDELGKEAVAGVTSLVQHDACLRELDLVSAELTVETLKPLLDVLCANTTLTKLGLYDNRIDDDGMDEIANMLRKNKSIRTLFLGGNFIGPDGAEVLTAALCDGNSTLQELRMNPANLEDEGAAAFAKVLRTNTALRVLGLDSCKIGAEGGLDLATALRGNTTLTELSIERNGIGEKCIAMLAEVLETNTTLLKLEVSSSSDRKVDRAIEKALKRNNNPEAKAKLFAELEAKRAQEDADQQRAAEAEVARREAQQAELAAMMATCPALSSLPPLNAKWQCRNLDHKGHQIFISYRVVPDQALTETLALAVSGSGEASVFLDKYCLQPGEEWEVGFLNGLRSARLVVLVISEATLEGIRRAHERPDNVLLEYEVALELASIGRAVVLPVIVGRYADSEVDGRMQSVYVPFSAFNVSVFSDSKPAHPSSRASSVRAIMAAVFKLQCEPCDPRRVRDAGLFVSKFYKERIASGAAAAATSNTAATSQPISLPAGSEPLRAASAGDGHSSAANAAPAAAAVTPSPSVGNLSNTSASAPSLAPVSTAPAQEPAAAVGAAAAPQRTSTVSRGGATAGLGLKGAWFAKMGQGLGVLTGRKRRFFQLVGDKIVYYAGLGAGGEPVDEKGYIQLCSRTTASALDSSLTILTPGSARSAARRWDMVAENAATAAEWEHCIRVLVKSLKV